MTRISKRSFASLAMLGALMSCGQGQSEQPPLPPSYYVDPVLGPLPMVSLDSLGEAAGRLEGEAEHPDPTSF